MSQKPQTSCGCFLRDADKPESHVSRTNFNFDPTDVYGQREVGKTWNGSLEEFPNELEASNFTWVCLEGC